MAGPSFILASASPRRADLLRGLGLSFEIVPSQVEETGPEHDPTLFAVTVARAKALEVAKGFAGPARHVLAADTIVVLGGEIFGKPRDEAHAEEMLGRLSGREHRVITAFCIVRAPAELCHEQAVETAVLFKDLSPREIYGYVKTGEPLDKAGAYAAQGVGMFLLRAVRGSYSNVVGLPVCEVMEALERLGVAHLFSEPVGA
jgi:septum formation protein